MDGQLRYHNNESDPRKRERPSEGRTRDVRQKKLLDPSKHGYERGSHLEHGSFPVASDPGTPLPNVDGLGEPMITAISHFYKQLQRRYPAMRVLEEDLNHTSSSIKEVELNQINMYEKWEKQFRHWSEPLRPKIQNNFDMQMHLLRKCLREVMAERKKLGLEKDSIEVSAQGSYSASTNTERSDIDIGIRLLWKPNSHSQMSHSKFDKFKGTDFIANLSKLYDRKSKLYKLNKLVEIFLKRTFKEEVDRSSWGYFKVSGASGILIEVLPAVVRGDAQEWVTDNGEHLSDPFKNVDNNRKMKDSTTRGRFKKVVRIFKNILYQMKGSNLENYEKITSHLIESIVYNAPDANFGHRQITDDLIMILKYGISQISESGRWKEWKRLDGKKNLFEGSRCFDREEAHRFLNDAWQYLQFGGIRPYSSSERASLETNARTAVSPLISTITEIDLIKGNKSD